MVRHLQAWANTIAYPEAPVRPDAGYNGYKLPVAQDLIDPPLASAETQRRCVELMLAAAVRLTHLKPAHLATTRIAVVAPFPALFHSAVDVFFDQARWHAFTRRNTADQRWAPLEPGKSLSRQLGFAVPPGFREHGYHCVYRDDASEPMYLHEDCWLYSEILPGDGVG